MVEVRETDCEDRKEMELAHDILVIAVLNLKRCYHSDSSLSIMLLPHDHNTA
jgi:hypothetical protein